jgi:hypothetical protein
VSGALPPCATGKMRDASHTNNNTGAPKSAVLVKNAS